MKNVVCYWLKTPAMIKWFYPQCVKTVYQPVHRLCATLADKINRRHIDGAEFTFQRDKVN